MGKKYTEEEKRHIQELTRQGYTDEYIAQQINRSTNAIRNIRHRNGIKTRETKTIQQLKQDKQSLTQQTQKLDYKLRQLERQRDQLRKALQLDGSVFKNKLETELIILKDQRPELFQITGEEQLAKLTTQLGISVLRWLLE